MFSEKCAFTWNDVLYVFHDSGIDIQLVLIIWTNVLFPLDSLEKDELIPGKWFFWGLMGSRSDLGQAEIIGFLKNKRGESCLLRVFLVFCSF